MSQNSIDLLAEKQAILERVSQKLKRPRKDRSEIIAELENEIPEGAQLNEQEKERFDALDKWVDAYNVYDPEVDDKDFEKASYPIRKTDRQAVDVARLKAAKEFMQRHK